MNFFGQCQANPSLRFHKRKISNQLPFQSGEEKKLFPTFEKFQDSWIYKFDFFVFFFVFWLRISNAIFSQIRRVSLRLDLVDGFILNFFPGSLFPLVIWFCCCCCCGNAPETVDRPLKGNREPMTICCLFSNKWSGSEVKVSS